MSVQKLKITIAQQVNIMSQEELEQKIMKLEAEISALKDVKKLLGARTALAWMGMASSAWRHTIVQKASSIRNYAYTLRRQIKAGANPANLDLTLEEIDKLAESIANYPVVPPLASEDSLEIIYVNEILQERIQQVQRNPAFSDVQISLQLSSHEFCLIRADRLWLVKGLDLLFQNSAEAMVSSVNKHITVRTFFNDNQVHIFIEDTGKGVSDDVKPLLFIQPIQKKKGEKGLGMGLLMAQMIFQSFGGELKLEKTDSKGSIFAISFPKVE